MGVRYLTGTYDDGTHASAMVDSVTGWAFGPHFDSLDGAQEFVDWLGFRHGVDPRELDEDTLEERYSEWQAFQRGDDGGKLMDAGQAARLRAPFDPTQIEKLPKAGITLDYVSHATTTNRLLEVDPEWTWRPFTIDERSSVRALDEELWIWLTVCGVTRPGVGDGKTTKERIGDAIRNAAMRFGVALDLWAKVDLDASHEVPAPDGLRTSGGAAPSPVAAPLPEPSAFVGGPPVFDPPRPTKAQKDLLLKLGRDAITGSRTDAAFLAELAKDIGGVTGLWPDVIDLLNREEVSTMIERVKNIPPVPVVA